MSEGKTTAYLRTHFLDGFHSRCNFVFTQIAIKLISCSETESTLTTAFILVMPTLQILSSTVIENCVSEEDAGITRQQLAINLLEIIQQEELKVKKETVMFQFSLIVL